MKVLLISANTLTTPYPVYPLGLDYVADAIAADHEIKIVDINNLGEHASLGKEIGDYSPDLIGLSLRNIDNADSVNRKGFISEYRQYVKTVRKH
ncbi:MAG: B12-binding domain-containing radical SAM protein, partial [Desulfobacteraceae bacterium]|nr:B12-binding domain-containing radical SAM protein [Desulfobacteraceae bacterium]